MSFIFLFLDVSNNVKKGKGVKTHYIVPIPYPFKINALNKNQNNKNFTRNDIKRRHGFQITIKFISLQRTENNENGTHIHTYVSLLVWVLADPANFPLKSPPPPVRRQYWGPEKCPFCLSTLPPPKQPPRKFENALPQSTHKDRTPSL